MTESMKRSPSGDELKIVITAMIKLYGFNCPICLVCQCPAQWTTKEIPKGKMCGDSLCDDCVGKRPAIEDYRAPNARILLNFIKESK